MDALSHAVAIYCLFGLIFAEAFRSFRKVRTKTSIPAYLFAMVMWLPYIVAGLIAVGRTTEKETDLE